MLFSLIWLGSIIATIFIADNKRLNVVGYAFLSLLLGPLGLLIALITPSRQQDKNSVDLSTPAVNSIESARREINIIKNTLTLLSARLNRLEESLNQISGKEIPPLVESQPTALTVGDNRQKKAEEPMKEGFEVVFGKYWLNRIGIVVFVLGVGLFISYTFQYLDPLAKVAIGYAIALSFFFWGNFLEKKEHYLKVAWGILGGGWGLMYLSTYAMYYIPATKIIDNPYLEMCLLALVSMATVIYNLKYKSWVVTALTYLLAFITVGLGGMDYSTVFFCAVLTLSIAYLSYKLQWDLLLFYGILGSYITYSCWLAPHLFDTFLYSRNYAIPVYQFQIGFGILSIDWILFSLTLFSLKWLYPQEIKKIVIALMTNALFFIVLGLNEVYRVRTHLEVDFDIRFWFLVVLASVYFLFALLYKNMKWQKVIVSCCSIALSLLAMAVMIRFPRLSVGFFWILEMMLLIGIGIYYKEFVYRILAFILGFFIMIRLFAVDFDSPKYYQILNSEFKHSVLIFTFASICFYLWGALRKRPWVKSVLVETERGLYAAGPVVATILLIFLIERESPSRWLSLHWTLLGMVILGVGFWLKDKIFRTTALVVLAMVCIKVVFMDLSGVNTIYKIIAFVFLGMVLLGVSLVYSKYLTKSQDTE